MAQSEPGTNQELEALMQRMGDTPAGEGNAVWEESCRRVFRHYKETGHLNYTVADRGDESVQIFLIGSNKHMMPILAVIDSRIKANVTKLDEEKT